MNWTVKKLRAIGIIKASLRSTLACLPLSEKDATLFATEIVEKLDEAKVFEEEVK